MIQVERVAVFVNLWWSIERAQLLKESLTVDQRRRDIGASSQLLTAQASVTRDQYDSVLVGNCDFINRCRIAQRRFQQGIQCATVIERPLDVPAQISSAGRSRCFTTLGGIQKRAPTGEKHLSRNESSAILRLSEYLLGELAEVKARDNCNDRQHQQR